MAFLKSDNWLYVHVPKTGGTSISALLSEEVCENLAVHGKLQSQRDLGNRFVFGFVRNPFEWFGSLYHAYIRENRKIKIEDFIDIHESWDYFFDTQTSWLEYNGNLDRIDFIGKYENLAEDFKFIQNKIGIEENTLQFKNYNTIRDTYPNLDMYDYYRKRCFTNPKVVQFVRNRYRKDFKNFDYGMAL